MSGNYFCPFCSSRYDFNPGRCACGEAVMFDGREDWQRSKREERERKAAAEQREREAAARRANEKAASEPKPGTAGANPAKGDGGVSSFSGKLAFLGFLGASIWAYTQVEQNLVLAGIVGLLGAGFLGMFGKFIIGVCVAILLLWFLITILGRMAS